MNIQQLIENAKQSLNAPQHHHALDEALRAVLNVRRVQQYARFRVKIQLSGPKQSGPDGERLRLKSAELYDEALKYCTNCKRCEIACPSDVKIGDIIVRARNKYLAQQHKPAVQKLRDAILSNTDIMGSLNTPLAPIVNTITGLKATKFVLEKALKISRHRTLPKYSFGTFRSWYRKNGGKPTKI